MTPAMKGYLFDQYARACGCEPPDNSWFLVLKTSGECEITALSPGEPLRCCLDPTTLAVETRGPHDRASALVAH